ncbi:histidine kinase [Undibacterium sp. CY18W]|uniref:Histidine kinase n=1 Tax=Undibacterium hunanense TaxID=2762292 RepID=A0ABR6ZR15_9BURK|nr:histidine kinase [Undibacterium hunanense]MBC3918305.1 histidine kinase [Undibacterium hunanense]
MKTAPTSFPRWPALPGLRQIVVVFLISLLIAWVTTPVFQSPFWLVLRRTTFIAMVMLLAFTVSGTWRLQWLPRWIPHWLVRVAAVCLLAPFASLAAYVAIAGDFMSFIKANNLLSGFATSTIFALFFGPLVAVAAIKREDKQRERADRLQLELEKSALEREVLDARLRLLQAQIEPHFLFNTLANVQALVESGSDNAAPVLRHLIAYLRAAMPRLNDADATLENEMQLVSAYLEIMHMRMPDRLQFELQLAPELKDLRFPAMALLTLVENAVRHGIDPGTEVGRIEVGGKRDARSGMVTLWVADTGIGMAETAVPGTGLTNVRARLQACFGKDARVDLHEQTPHGLRVELIFHSGAKT